MLPQPGINPDHLAPKGHCSFLPFLLSKPPELCLVLTGSNIYKGAGINLRGASAFFPQKSVPRQLETPKWSSPGLLRTCTNSHAKGFTSFLPCTCSTSPLWPHEHHSICSQLSWAPRPAQFNGVENTLHDFFFSSWQSCLFPAVVKSDFYYDCPSAADISLVWGKKITSFSPPCSLMGITWWVLLLLCHPEKDLKAGRTGSTPPTPTRDQKADSGIANRAAHKGEGKTPPEVGTDSRLIYLQILVWEERSSGCFVLQPSQQNQNSLAPMGQLCDPLGNKGKAIPGENQLLAQGQKSSAVPRKQRIGSLPAAAATSEIISAATWNHRQRAEKWYWAHKFQPAKVANSITTADFNHQQHSVNLYRAMTCNYVFWEGSDKSRSNKGIKNIHPPSSSLF